MSGNAPIATRGVAAMFKLAPLSAWTNYVDRVLCGDSVNCGSFVAAHNPAIRWSETSD